MISSRPIVRSYAMTDGELLQKADFTALMVERDAAEFATRNVADAAALRAARNAFDDFPQDQQLAGNVMTATAAKNAALAALKDELAPLRGMAALAFRKRPGIYKSFGFGRFSTLTDNDACRAARLMARLAAMQMTALAAHGFSPPLLAALDARITAFEEGLDAQKMAEAIRIQQTEERVMLGNALHEELSILCSIGQSLFANTDEARYNDYVLYAGA